MITVHDFTKHVLMQRPEELALCARVSELWVLDQFSRARAVEQEQMTRQVNVINSYAKRIVRQSEVYDGTPPHEAGRRWELPKRVVGSPSYLRQKLSQGMVVIARRGPPTLFLTFTFNALKNTQTVTLGWPEVAQILRVLDIFQDDVIMHPWLTVRVFRNRMAMLECMIRSGILFGRPVDYHQRCKEYQKRGFSHSHHLLRLRGRQPLTSEEIGRYSWARLFVAEKCPNTAPKECAVCTCLIHRLYRCVQQFNVHRCRVGVCKTNAASPCKKGFPKPLTPLNYLAEDGRFVFARLEEQDQWVVEYNPTLIC
jgi:hypothetical protein